MQAQISFHQGDVQTTLELLKTKVVGKAEEREARVQATMIPNPPATTVIDTMIPFPSSADLASIITSIQEIEALKEEGNNDIRAHRFSAALTSYTKALTHAPTALSSMSAAILYCNRAAAHQGLGNIALAVADCCRAKAMRPGYAKAHSRLATLLCDLHMYSAAKEELEAALVGDGVTPEAKAEYRRRAHAAEVAGTPRRGYGALIDPPTNHYKMLGVEHTCAVNDVRRAYKKLALYLHPDKVTSNTKVATQVGHVGTVLREPAERVHTLLQDHATWLFKCVSNANEALGDATARREVDVALRRWEMASHGRQSPQQQHYDGYYGGYTSYYRPHGHGHNNNGRNYNYANNYNAQGSRGGGSSHEHYKHYW